MRIMNIWSFTFYEIKAMMRNYISLALVLIMPILMVFLMGNVMDGIFSKEEPVLAPFTLLYENQDQGNAGRALDQWITALDGRVFYLIPISPGTMNERLAKEKGSIGLQVPGSLTERLDSGQRSAIEIVTTENDPIKEGVLTSILSGFSSGYRGKQAAIMVSQSLGKPVAPEQYDAISQQNMGKYGSEFITPVQVSKASGIDGLSTFQYFSASMLIFFLLTSGMGVGSTLIQERLDRVYSRIHSFPVRKGEYLLGKVLGNGVFALLQVVLHISVTATVFGVHWGSNLLGILLVVLPIILISSGLSVLLSLLVNTTKAVTSVLTILFWFMTFLSGGFTGMTVMKEISYFTVNHWGFTALTALMQGGAWEDILGSLLVLFSLGLVLWLASVYFYDRRVGLE